MTAPLLGFGTAPMLGRISRSDSLRALELAWSHGVRHFDTARSYGWGEAEGLLGSFLSDKDRSGVTIVTKCGIAPPKRSGGLGRIKSAARWAVKTAPALAPVVRRAGQSRGFAMSRTYDLRTLSDSFATSLIELKTDYADILILHSFAVDLDGLDEVVDWMRGLVLNGSVKKLGFSLGGQPTKGLEYLDRRGYLDDAVIQMPLSEEFFSVSKLWSNMEFIVHSPFRYLISVERAEGRPHSLGDVWARLSEVGCVRAVVCSMFTPSHILSNVRAAAGNG
jgi:aryl-alcohol dehydrogenase-like predicted oxidoreductase